MLKIWRNKDIRGEYGPFDDERDADFVKLRMIAIRQAQETMERVVSERDNPYTYNA
jgi:hypothetical protein